MKLILATLATFSILFALACAPVDPPPPCDAAGIGADTRPRLRVHVDERWLPKYAVYVRMAFETLPVDVVEVDRSIADVTISPNESEVTDCVYGTGHYYASIYVSWRCHEYDVEGITRDVRSQLDYFVRLAR